MAKYRYTAYIDGNEVYAANHIKYLKEIVQFDFDYLNAYRAVIRMGNKVVATKMYDGDWQRVSYNFDAYENKKI